MSLDLDFVEPAHQELTSELLAEIAVACQDAETSANFIAMQLNPGLVWKGWPSEVAEDWLESRPSVLGRHFEGDGTTAADVGRALRKRLRDVYRPSTGGKPGTKPRQALAGLEVAEAVSEALDTVTWDTIRKFGGSTDDTSIRQLVKLPAPGEDDHAVVVKSAGTVREEALSARYTSIRGDLYWSDIRNSLELWIRARPELLDEHAEWVALGEPRAFHDGGRWISKGENDRREHNPLVHILATARKRAADIVTRWARDGFVSLDALMEEGGESAIEEARKARPERVQHRAPKPGAHYAWGLRDDVNCYNFPVDHLLPDSRY